MDLPTVLCVVFLGTFVYFVGFFVGRAFQKHFGNSS